MSVDPHPEFERRKSEERRGDETTAYAGHERRKLDRRSIDNLRTDVEWNVAEETEDGLFSRVGSKFPVKPARFALMAIAIIAGGSAAFIATRSTPEVAPPPVTEYVAEARAQILVANETIKVGQRVTPAAIAWGEWPEDSVRADYITQTAQPDALTEMSGTVARFEIFPGEPIRAEKLSQRTDGFLSAILERGMRGVSVSVAAEAASGGFIAPNDRVDVLLTGQMPKPLKAMQWQHWR